MKKSILLPLLIIFSFSANLFYFFRKSVLLEFNPSGVKVCIDGMEQVITSSTLNFKAYDSVDFSLANYMKGL